MISQWRVTTLLSTLPIIVPLAPHDRESWEVLARGYKAFYKTELSADGYETAWRRLVREDGIFGLGAKLQDRLVGITHYLFHTTVWAPKACYLQDLFVARDFRGQGIARALIEAVAERARREQAVRLYWLTQEDNVVARTLYDKVAKFNGFIRYEVSLDSAQ